MRLDKFLKVSCIFVTRSSAEKAINRGNVILNNNKTKPSSNIKIGDYLSINFPLKKVEFQILKICEKNVSKKDAKEMTKIIKEEKIEF